MSLIVKGMDMPSKCRSCPCCADKGLISIQGKYFCSAVYFAPDIDNLDQKLSACPLIEIPSPHGRLIDADKLLKHKYGISQTARTYIKTADTVIEAEEGDENV